MENVKEIIARLGIETDKTDELEKAILANYRTKAELDSKASTIADLKARLAEAGEGGKAAEEAEETIADLKAKLAEYEKAEEQAKADKAEADARTSFKAKFDAAVGERKFANKLISDAVFSQAFDKAKANPDMDAKSIVDGITDDMDGVWVNPQRDPSKMPKPTAAGSNASPLTSMEQVEARTKGMSANERVTFFRDHMAEIDKLIKEG